ncbi:MAG TPA: DnaJ domain-containing protein, partial [Candidatus Manganitrophaceae bacterium]
SEDVITINMSTANLILEGVRRINDWTRLMNDLPPLNHVLQVATDPRDLFQTMNMTSMERDVMRQVDGRRSLRDILTLSSIPSMECAKVLYFLIAIGILRADAPLSSQPAAEGPSAQKKSDSGSTAEKEKIEKTEKGEELEALKEAVLEEERPSTRQKIHEAYLSLEKQNYYQSLHLPKTATREEVKKAYFTLAKEYHPDRHFEPGMEEIKKELEALFIKIKEAYDTLASEGKRKAYDLELVSGKSPRKESAVVVTPRDLFAQGEEALRRGDLRNACYFFKEAIEKAPEKIENSIYYLRYGQTLSRVPGKLREAAEVLRKGIALDPTRLDFFMELGSIYHKTGLTQKAIAAFSEVLKRDPDHQKAKEEIEKLQASFP